MAEHKCRVCGEKFTHNKRGRPPVTCELHSGLSQNKRQLHGQFSEEVKGYVDGTLEASHAPKSALKWIDRCLTDATRFDKHKDKVEFYKQARDYTIQKYGGPEHDKETL